LWQLAVKHDDNADSLPETVAFAGG